MDFTLASSLLHLLHRASQIADDLFASHHQLDGLTSRQLVVLAAISSREGASQTDITAMTGVVDGWRLTRGARRKGATVQRFTDIRDQGATVAGYLATYLLPLIGVSVDGARDVAAYAIYFFVALVVFVRSDLALVNPTLYLLGWRVVVGRPEGTDPTSAAGVNSRLPEALIICRDLRVLDAPVSATRLAGCFVVVDTKKR